MKIKFMTITQNKKYKAIGILFFSFCFFYSIARLNYTHIQELSVSSDGKYAISTSNHNRAYLWDLEKKCAKKISNHAGRHSAYFIKNTHYFLWRNKKTRETIVQDIQGNVIKKFSSPWPYRHVMSQDLNHYYLINHKSEILYKVKYKNIYEPIKILEKHHRGDYMKNLLVDDLHLHEPLNKILCDHTIFDINNPEKQVSTESFSRKKLSVMKPNGKNVIIGNDYGSLYKWNFIKNKKYKMDCLYNGKSECIHNTSERYDIEVYHDKTNVIKLPFTFSSPSNNPFDEVFALKYIDEKGHFLRFFIYGYYVALYNDKNNFPDKYIHLGKPRPVNTGDTRDNALDTAPKAKVLVMAKNNGVGVITYQFDSETKTLERKWTSSWWQTFF